MSDEKIPKKSEEVSLFFKFLYSIIGILAQINCLNGYINGAIFSTYEFRMITPEIGHLFWTELIVDQIIGLLVLYPLCMLLIAFMSLLSFLFGYEKQETSRSAAPTPSTVKPAQGWIRLYKGKPELAQQAIKAYAGNFKKLKPKDFRMSIAEHPTGFLAVTFPDGIPPYDLINLIGWLNEPPETKGVSGATGWITSPTSSLLYSLQPDSGNEWGDTLVGTSSDNKVVQVYQPDATMCEISRYVTPLPEPNLSTIPNGSGITFLVTLDADPSFRNPELKITHPKDTKFKTTHPKDTNWNK